MSDSDLRALWRAHVDQPTPETYGVWARAAARAGIPWGLDLIRADARWPRAAARTQAVFNNPHDPGAFPPEILARHEDSAVRISLGLYHRARRALRNLYRLEAAPLCPLPGGIVGHVLTIRAQETRDRAERRKKLAGRASRNERARERRQARRTAEAPLPAEAALVRICSTCDHREADHLQGRTTSACVSVFDCACPGFADFGRVREEPGTRRRFVVDPELGLIAAESAPFRRRS